MKFMLRETFNICREIHLLKNSLGQKGVVVFVFFESLDKRKENKINILLVKLRLTKTVRPKDVRCLYK